jgi:prepilin-type N-terminal cleavage/methylation domain-containing protein
MKRQSGFSLVELLLALAITAAVMVPLLGLLTTTAAASSHTGPRFELERQADFAVQRIAAQLRAGAPTTNYTLNGGKLIETKGTVTSTLAESVTAFSQSVPVNAVGQQLVQISLTLTRGDASATAVATVRAGGAR